MTRFLLLQNPPVVDTPEMVQIRNFCITDCEGCEIPGTYLPTPVYIILQKRVILTSRGGFVLSQASSSWARFCVLPDCYKGGRIPFCFRSNLASAGGQHMAGMWAALPRVPIYWFCNACLQCFSGVHSSLNTRCCALPLSLFVLPV